MPKNLVIVESPAKAKTIEKYLGKDYVVRSSFGHIRDLPKKGLNIDVGHNFSPTYAISPDKTKIVAELKKLAKGSDVWLASDEDREGEAIAWHLTQALGLDPKKTKRIVFHEITKTAIEHAIQNPRVVDLKLVDAQQARYLTGLLVMSCHPCFGKRFEPV
jgi:DNA topoisomerase-1